VPGFSVRPREDEFEQLWFNRDEARTPVKAPRLLVGFLDDDSEWQRPLRNRIPLCVGEQLVSDAAPLVAGRDEQLLDDDRAGFGTAQGDVSGWSTLRAGDEDHIVLKHPEYALVAPAGHAGERALREREKLRQWCVEQPSHSQSVRIAVTYLPGAHAQAFAEKLRTFFKECPARRSGLRTVSGGLQDRVLARFGDAVRIIALGERVSFALIDH